MLNVEFDDAVTQPFLEKLVIKLFELMKPLIGEYMKDDDIVSKSYLQTEKFHCSPTKIDIIVKTPGFPRMLLGESENYQYSLKAVDKWIAENQLYN